MHGDIQVEYRQLILYNHSNEKKVSFWISAIILEMLATLICLVNARRYTLIHSIDSDVLISASRRGRSACEFTLHVNHNSVHKQPRLATCPCPREYNQDRPCHVTPSRSHEHISARLVRTTLCAQLKLSLAENDGSRAEGRLQVMLAGARERLELHNRGTRMVETQADEYTNQLQTQSTMIESTTMRLAHIHLCPANPLAVEPHVNG
jgi:hypothetical protein